MAFSFSFLQLTTANNGSTLNLINLCQSYGLIPKIMLYSSGFKPMNLALRAELADEYHWRCDNKILYPKKVI